MTRKMLTYLACPFIGAYFRCTSKTAWRLRSILSVLGFVSLSGFGGLASASEAEALEVCNVAAFQTTLQAVSGSLEARAYWLNRQLAKWPRTQDVAAFKLYSSTSGMLEVAVGQRVVGADVVLSLDVFRDAFPTTLSTRFKFVADGMVLKIRDADLSRAADLQRRQVVLVQENADGVVLKASGLQSAGALDDLYAPAKNLSDLGVTVSSKKTSFKLWAPTAQKVSVCRYEKSSGAAKSFEAMQWNAATGIWSLSTPADLSGQYYLYVVEVFVPGVGMVRNRVTDPYSISLTADSKRSYIARLDSAKLQPKSWNSTPAPTKVKAQTDMAVYELHVRDFSINDSSVSTAHRGKYLAFTEINSNGMQHLRALSKAGMTDVHLLPVFDFGSVPEVACLTPDIKADMHDEMQLAAVSAVAEKDCFNWGYDPFHYSAPEGSYATDAADGATRILEFRQMVTALHQAGLRVGMDVVYNHTFVFGQSEKSVLDRIVPGYYHRLNAVGQVEQTTCNSCGNTATENLMMGKLLVDSVLQWAKEYKIDSFRFDLMAHQPRAVMEELQGKLKAQTGREIQLIGEGWNFGEIANGARFVQASQLSLNGTGIGTFSDRSRDAVRGGGAADTSKTIMTQKGYINGLADPDQNASDLFKAADMLRVGLAGSLREYVMTTYDGTKKALKDIDYSGQPAGYVSQPGEVVNYVENHDNQTLFDLNVYKLPLDTSRADRARVQMLGAATTAFSQGVAYFHAGLDVLRSKSLDRDSFNSGDWFNRLDWSYQTNNFAIGLPPKAANGEAYFLMQPLLANPLIKPTSDEIKLARDMFRDLLKIRASSSLFHLRTAAEVQQRLHFENVGAGQNGAVIVGHLDGKNYPDAHYKSVIYFINVSALAQSLDLPNQEARAYVLHPVHVSANAADKRIAATASYSAAQGRFTLPALSAVVFVEK
ncbi:MAG: alpha-1,6-glucosidase domain-containing protein [Pseudomonadota bacterium]